MDLERSETWGESGGYIPAHTKKDVSEVNTDLAVATSSWLRKHGKAVRAKLSVEQKNQLQECFSLMDADGSGAIDAEELGDAFQLLGINVTKAEITKMVLAVDHDGSGEVEYPEFEEIMTSTLQKLAEEKAEKEGADNVDPSSSALPFDIVASAYRRKRLMEGLTSDDKEMQQQIVQMADEMMEGQRRQEAKAAEMERRQAALRAQRLSTPSLGMDQRAAKGEASVRTRLRQALRQAPSDLDATLEVFGDEEVKVLKNLLPKRHQGFSESAVLNGRHGSFSSRSDGSQRGSPTAAMARMNSFLGSDEPSSFFKSSSPVQGGSLAASQGYVPVAGGHGRAELLSIPAKNPGFDLRYMRGRLHLPGMPKSKAASAAPRRPEHPQQSRSPTFRKYVTSTLPTSEEYLGQRDAKVLPAIADRRKNSNANSRAGSPNPYGPHGAPQPPPRRGVSGPVLGGKEPVASRLHLRAADSASYRPMGSGL